MASWLVAKGCGGKEEVKTERRGGIWTAEDEGWVLKRRDEHSSGSGTESHDALKLDSVLVSIEVQHGGPVQEKERKTQPPASAPMRWKSWWKRRWGTMERKGGMTGKGRTSICLLSTIIRRKRLTDEMGWLDTGKDRWAFLPSVCVDIASVLVWAHRRIVDRAFWLS